MPMRMMRDSARPTTDDLIWAAVRACGADRMGYDSARRQLADRAPTSMTALSRHLGTAVAALWSRGWAPLDLVRAAEREQPRVIVDRVADVIVEDGRQRALRGESLHPRWSAQLDALTDRPRADVEPSPLDTAIAALRYLTRLPDLPRTMPAPGERWTDPRRDAPRIDEGLLGRVRGLLAKAESTEFEAEAEALTAKAQELIARHAIDEALLHRPDDVGDASVRRILIDDPYADAKSSLVARVAEANHCTAVYTPHWGWCDVFGYEQDLDAVELLAASLLAQATGAMARHGSVVNRYGRSATKSFRRSFLFGFANRIGERLLQTTGSEVAKVAATEGSLLPVLASREEHVTAARDAAFPQLKTKRSTVSNVPGYAAGQFAADQASLDPAAGALHR